MKNANVRVLFFAGALILLSLMRSGAARADTTYLYIGNAYTSCFSPYACNGTSPALSITLDTSLTGAALDSLTAADVTSTIVSFTASDGMGALITQSNVVTGDLFKIWTGASGDITQWQVDISSNVTGSAIFSFSSPLPAQTTFGACTDHIPSNTFDSSCHGVGYGSNTLSAGSWSMPVTPTPEPATLLLLGTGLLATWAMGLRRTRTASH